MMVYIFIGHESLLVKLLKIEIDETSHIWVRTQLSSALPAQQAQGPEFNFQYKTTKQKVQKSAKIKH